MSEFRNLVLISVCTAQKEEKLNPRQRVMIRAYTTVWTKVGFNFSVAFSIGRTDIKDYRLQDNFRGKKYLGFSRYFHFAVDVKTKTNEFLFCYFSEETILQKKFMLQKTKLYILVLNALMMHDAISKGRS